ESWLLAAVEEELHRTLRRWVGLPAPRPHHVVVNGWYFDSINWLSARSLPAVVWRFVRDPRRAAAGSPLTVRYSVPIYEQEWRKDLLPRYRAAVARAEERVERLSVEQLPALIDELAALAGEYFASIAALAGAGYKLEMHLAMAYRRHLGK